MPKFRDLAVWQQAEQLMQPAFIRVVDNIRKQLEQSLTWRGSYEETIVWPEGTSEEIKAEVMKLRADLDTASLSDIDVIRSKLAQLPVPYPGYLLCLTHNDRQITVDVWDLCYQVAFRNYDSASGTSWTRGFGQAQNETVEVDTSLIDAEGEVDWHRLDDKAQRIVERVFVNLTVLE